MSTWTKNVSLTSSSVSVTYTLLISSDGSATVRFVLRDSTLLCHFDVKYVVKKITSLARSAVVLGTKKETSRRSVVAAADWTVQVDKLKEPSPLVSNGSPPPQIIEPENWRSLTDSDVTTSEATNVRLNS